MMQATLEFKAEGTGSFKGLPNSDDDDDDGMAINPGGNDASEEEGSSSFNRSSLGL